MYQLSAVMTVRANVSKADIIWHSYSVTLIEHCVQLKSMNSSVK